VNLTGGELTGHHRDMNRATHPYAGYHYPAEIISHAVWWYFRFTLSCRTLEGVCAGYV
jgi:transposase-like protein